MKSIIFCALTMMLTTTAVAQSELLIKSNSKGLYIDHKVSAKENFYSIGRLFNVHPKHLAAFNSLDMSKGLGLGQMIKIPLSDTNFNQKSDQGTPIYYITSNSEGLYRVSTSNNNVLMEKLAKWNHLTNENVTAGTKLIVGFLVTNEAAAIATTTQQKTETANKPSQENTTDVAKNNLVDNDSKKQEVKKEEETRKEEAKKEEEVKKEEPKKEVAVQPKDEIRSQSSKQGYFRISFDQQIKQQPITKEQTLTSGIFKTASGWSDSKYYLLMDGVEPGTIVKITNPANSKIIYAKLLGEMTAAKTNQAVNIRISNAAASALDITETDKFIVKLNY